ncbi:MAG: DUF1642 domain-containing protein [Lactococcus raffinolactis]|jgi:hypothetical protein|nr:DUF1642 domain-containing protein [Lactococcus raffinolactis]
MSNFEHRITEDSTEFEKAFLKIYDGSLWTALDKMKDWQPPKQLVVVPQCVADWFEKNEDDLSFKIWGYLINWKLQDKKSDFFRWMKKESECIEILIRMQDGYTVEKEKKYILKHIDLSKLSTDDSLYLEHGFYKRLLHARYSKDVDMSKIEHAHFTQSEIDKLHIGSYEQIEVEP